MFKLIFALNILAFFSGCKASSSMADYDKIVTFSKDELIKFPDFELKYAGEHKQTANFPNGNSFTFTYYDFKIKNDKEEKTISWSSGTGEIAPLSFEFGGMKFMIELRYYGKERKQLDEDELVITKL